MRFWRAMLPNITIALDISILVLLYLDGRNPMMGFLSSTCFLVLMVLTAVCSIANAIVLYGDWRKKEKNIPENSGKISE